VISLFLHKATRLYSCALMTLLMSQLYTPFTLQAKEPSRSTAGSSLGGNVADSGPISELRELLIEQRKIIRDLQQEVADLRAAVVRIQDTKAESRLRETDPPLMQLASLSGLPLSPAVQAPAQVPVHSAQNAISGTESSPTKVSAEFGKGVNISSGDGKFGLTLRGRFQVRATPTKVFDVDTPEGSSSEFLVRRARLSLQGHVFNKDWQYTLQFGFAGPDTESDLRVPLRDAYLTSTAVRDLSFRFGQMKVPFDRQRVTSSSALQMVDRSVVVSELSLDRDVGFYLFSDNFLGLDQRLRYQAGIFGGDGRNRTSDAPGILWVGRLQYQPFGAFDDSIEGDFSRESHPRLALAAGVARNQNSNRSRSTSGSSFEFARFDYSHWEADMIFKWRGFSLTSEAISRRANAPYREATIAGQLQREYSRSAWGYFVQPAYMFTNHWEIAARWGRTHPIGMTDPNLGKGTEVGPSLSWYLKEHSLKVQTDYFYLTGVDSPEERRHQLRLQMQLYF
jgi:phosphate-selective porin OprO and OprP